MASDSYVDFAALKASASIEDVLERYKLTGQFRPKGSQLVGPCPLCESQHETAFQADIEKDCWYCFAEGEGGSVIDFVARHEDVGLRTAGLRIAEWFDAGSGAKVDSSPESPTPGDRETATAILNEPLDFKLESLAAEHPRVQELGIRPRTAAHFGAGYCTAGLMEGRLAIPIHNRAGELVAYTGRATDGEEPAYLYPDGFDRAQEVFNLHRVASAGLSVEYGVYLAPEPARVLRLWQAGIENAVSYLGTVLSARQIELLAEALPHGRRVTIICQKERVPAPRSVAALTRSFYVNIVELDAR